MKNKLIENIFVQKKGNKIKNMKKKKTRFNCYFQRLHPIMRITHE